MAMLQFLRNRCGSKTSATRSTSGRFDAAETSNHLRTGEPAATRRVALCWRIPTGFRPKAQGCEGRATLGHRPTNIPNRNAVAANSFPSGHVTFATTPLALFPFPARTPKVGVTRQPWAGGRNPFGIVRSAGLRRHRPALRELADRRFEAYPSCTSGLLRQVELV